MYANLWYVCILTKRPATVLCYLLLGAGDCSSTLLYLYHEFRIIIPSAMQGCSWPSSTSETSLTWCRASISLSRVPSSFLDDDLLEATAQAAGMAVRERRSGTVSPSLQEAARSVRNTSSDSQEAPAIQAADPNPKGLTMEDSAEIQGTTRGPPTAKTASSIIKAAPAPSAQTPAANGRAPAQPARSAKQPSCGCTIC